MAKAERITAEALGRVLARNVSAGRAVEFPELLLETDAELAAEQERLQRKARAVRRARQQLRDAQLQIAVAGLSRSSTPGDVEREFRRLDMALGPPRPPQWHPEYPLNPESDL